MKCEDAKSRLPDLALGDLDAEPARAVEEHLASCGACRAERESLARVAGVLRAGSAVPPSTERREAAVVAMARAHAAPAPRRGWLPWTAAAVAAVALFSILLRPSPPVLTAVSGNATLFRAATAEWAPLAAGDRVRPGDRLRGEARISLEGGWVSLDPDTNVAVLADGRLSLDQGRLTAELGEGAGRPLVITDTGNNTVTLRRGRVEAGLRKVEGKVLGAKEVKGEPRTEGMPRTESAMLLEVRVAEGEADLGGARLQRLVLRAGQQGWFTIDGQPSAASQGR